ncbi:MAG: hypothetical protein ABSH21_12860 [Verrucomicrobiia bacterium]|jgi:uncharacterized membrane protein YuzA (DUF378 family)
MNAQVHVVLLTVGMIVAVVFPILIFASRRCVFAVWARFSSLLVCLAGLGWGVLGFVLLHQRSSMSPHAYFALGRIKALLAGLCVGLVLSILIARPYQKVTREKTENA